MAEKLTGYLALYDKAPGRKTEVVLSKEVRFKTQADFDDHAYLMKRESTGDFVVLSFQETGNTVRLELFQNMKQTKHLLLTGDEIYPILGPRKLNQDVFRIAQKMLPLLDHL